MAKKTTNKKINSSKTKKTVDVSDVEAIMEDMKNLALQKPEETVKTKAKGKCLDDVVYGNEIAKKTEEVESDVNTDMQDVDMVATQSPQSEIENVRSTEQLISKDANNIEEQNLSFIEEINNGEIIVEDEAKVEEKPKDIENKPKHKSYSEMFGNTWCGYGYTTD